MCPPEDRISSVNKREMGAGGGSRWVGGGREGSRGWGQGLGSSEVRGDGVGEGKGEVVL